MLDTAPDVRALLAWMFDAGATRVRLQDQAVAVAAAAEADTGAILLIEHDGVAAACVWEGKRLPLCSAAVETSGPAEHA